jgi:glycine hydroxymethyltransferase
MDKSKDRVFDLIQKEEKRQQETLMLIPSENYASKAVREALGSVLTNKYAEGYPGKRYYQGNKVADQVEQLAIDRAKQLFGVPYVNVQPYSGSPANLAVYLSLVNPGEKVMGMELRAGGHLTHGSMVNFSGILFQSVSYSVGADGWIDYDEIAKQAKEFQPKLIWAGATAYPRIIDWQKFAQIADSIGAWLVADIAHYAGLIVGGVYPSPVPYVDIITTTTHKTLRGPRGAMILVTKKGLKKDIQLGDKINRWVFPGLQGGPHLNTIASVAVALAEASQPEFKNYAQQIVKNAQVLAGELKKYGFNLITGGTDNHLILIDLRRNKIEGKKAAVLLEKSGIIVNANTVPHDPASPIHPSGIRLGTPVVTTQGMKEKEMILIAGLIKQSLAGQDVHRQVKELCLRFPL